MLPFPFMTAFESIICAFSVDHADSESYLRNHNESVPHLQ
jgi:hypothetical protein